jgi:hypothetical protein
MKQKEILNQMQEQAHLLHNALEKYKYQFDQETLAMISEELSALTQNVTGMEKELLLLQQMTDNPQSKKDES